MAIALLLSLVSVPAVDSQQCISRSLSLRGLFYKLKMNEWNMTRIIDLWFLVQRRCNSIGMVSKGQTRLRSSYAPRDLELAFQRALTWAVAKEAAIAEGQPEIKTGEPVVLHGFPLNLDDLFINPEIPSSKRVRSFQARAWKGLQMAALSHSTSQKPQWLLPEPIKASDLLTHTVIFLVSLLGFCFC